MLKVRAPILLLASSLSLAACVTPSAEPGAREPAGAGLMSQYLQARYADLTNAPDTASQRYLEALKQAPGDQILAEGAIASALVAGDVQRASEAASLAKGQSGTAPLGRLTLATLALRDGRFSAIASLLKNDDGPPVDRLAGRLLRAWSLAGEGKTDEAVASITNSAESAPFAQLFEYQSAMILERAGRNDEAIKSYQTALSGGLSTPPAILEYAALLQRMGKTKEAIDVYKRVLADNDDPSLAAALAHAERGDPPAPSRLSKVNEGAAIGMLSLAALLFGQTEPNFYLPYLTLALTLDPSLDSARLGYAQGLAGLHQWGPAFQALALVPASSPFFERALVERVFLFRAQGDEDGALKAAREGVAQTQGALARLALADALREEEKWSEAEPIYDALVRDASGDATDKWRLYFARGACLERMGRWSEAEHDLKQALALSPDQPEVLNYLGYSWIDQGINLKEGIKLIERAVALQPDAGYIVDSLGWAYFKLGDYGPAVEHLERAVELSPDDAILNDHLGDGYWREGRRAEARYQWTRALTMKPSKADSARIKDKLANGLAPTPVKHTSRADKR